MFGQFKENTPKNIVPKTSKFSNMEKIRDEREAFKAAEKKVFKASLTPLDDMIFGMPPNTHISDAIVNNSMPTAKIVPCVGNFDWGTHLIKLNQEDGWTEYLKVLESVNFTKTKKYIEVAYLANNFPTDTFTNDYSETLFERMANGVSNFTTDFAQIFGMNTNQDMLDFGDKIGDKLSDMPYAGSMFKKMKTMASSAKNNIQSDLGKNASSALSIAGSSILSSISGGRVDYPKMWKSSNFTPSYTMTIRLWNPDPSNPSSTKKYIVGPIAAILALALPKVGKEKISSYKWPFLCKVISPGIYNLDHAYINNISIIKGGDQLSIGYNQVIKMCDVRIEFGSLFNTVLAGEGSNAYNSVRPTFSTYLEAIGGKSVTSAKQNKELYDTDNTSPIGLGGSSGPEVASNDPTNALYTIKGHAPTTETPAPRVSVEKKSTVKDLAYRIAEDGSIYYVELPDGVLGA